MKMLLDDGFACRIDHALRFRTEVCGEFAAVVANMPNDGFLCVSDRLPPDVANQLLRDVCRFLARPNSAEPDDNVFDLTTWFPAHPSADGRTGPWQTP